MSPRYHTLLVRNTNNGKWSIEFGSYDREEVQYEKDEFKEGPFRAKDLKIITTSDDQASIDAAVAALNT